MKAKDKRKPFQDQIRRELQVTEPLARVHADTSGPYDVGKDGERYRLAILDEGTGLAATVVVETKHQIPQLLIEWKKQAETKHRKKLVELHTDGGSEFVNKAIEAECARTGTKCTGPSPYTPEHRAMIERLNGVLDEITRALMLHAGAPRALWPHATAQAARIRNRVLLRGPDRMRSPHQLWHGIETPISMKEFKVWGCDAWALIEPHQRVSKKLGERSRRLIHLGYEHDRQSWLLMDPSSHELVYSRNVTFEEKSFSLMHQLAREDDLSEDLAAPAADRPPAGPDDSDLLVALLISK
jgi:hypothetical protein